MSSKDRSMADEGFRPANAIDLSLNRERQDPPTPLSPSLSVTERITRLPKAVVFDKTRGGFWACVHRHPLPRHSDPREPADPRSYIPGHLQNTYPWDAFYPCKGFSDDRLFGRLVMSRSQLVDSMVQNGLGQWMLPSKLRRSWQSLEENLSQVVHTIENASTAPMPPLNLPIWPSKEGYTRAHGSRDRAVDAALRSITAFGEVCSFAAFYLSRWKTASETSPFEPIALYLLAQTNVGHAWLDDLFKSPVGLTPPQGRTGGMIDLFSTPWYQSLHVWAEYGVPLWIWLTADPYLALSTSNSNPEFLRCWLPPMDCLKEALAKQFPLPPPPERPLSEEDRIRLSDWERQAWLADQWAGESFEIFFNRMRHTMAQQQRIAAPRHPEPPETWGEAHETSGIRYYHWRSIGSHPLRYHVLDITRAKALYEAHAPLQRFFNPYDNSIDFLWMLDHSMGPTIFDAAILENSMSLPYEQYQKTPSHTEISHLYQRGHRSYSFDTDNDNDDDDESEYDDMDLDALPSRLAPLSEGTPPPAPSTAEYLTMVVRKRLGYFQSHGSPPPSTANVKEIVLQNTFGATGSPIPPSLVNATSDIVCTLLKPLNLSSLSRLWDISAISPVPLDWQRFPLRIASGSMTDGAHTHPRYIIGIPTTPLQEQWFVVVLPSATSVMQIIRFGWTGVLEIVRELSRRGIKFNTAKYLAPGEAPPRKPRVERVGLGVRYEDSKWVEEYLLWLAV